MVKTKGLERSVKNWTGSIPIVSGRYTDGVDAASGVIEASKAAEDLWAEKMAAAVAARARSKGLDKVTDADWKRKAKEKGAARIGPGMRAAEDKFRSGMSEVISTIEGVSLPPRGPSGRENLVNRAGPIVDALEALGKRRKGY